MEHETIVAVYDTAADARAAVRDLQAAGVPASDITQHAKDGSLTGTSRSIAPVHEKGFWASLFGGEPDHDTAVYGHSIDGGSTVVTVKVPSYRHDEAAVILDRHDPIDVDERSTAYGLTNSSASTPISAGAHADVGVGSLDGRDEPAESAAEAGAIRASGLTPVPAAAGGPGKRAVTGGTARIRRYTVEKPA